MDISEEEAFVFFSDDAFQCCMVPKVDIAGNGKFYCWFGKGGVSDDEGLFAPIKFFCSIGLTYGAVTNRSFPSFDLNGNGQPPRPSDDEVGTLVASPWCWRSIIPEIDEERLDELLEFFPGHVIDFFHHPMRFHKEDLFSGIAIAFQGKCRCHISDGTGGAPHPTGFKEVIEIKLGFLIVDVIEPDIETHDFFQGWLAVAGYHLLKLVEHGVSGGSVKD